MALDEFGRHIGGQCRFRGQRTRLHHALKWRLASSLREAGFTVDVETTVPELWDAEKQQAAVMDLQ